MAKPAPVADESPAPPLALTDSHRASARARGADVDVLLTILHAAIGDVALILREIIAAAPPDDRNLKTLERKLELFTGEARLFAS
jgi:hypothetical protein